MAINKKLIHFKNYSDFNSKKLSANETNTAYRLGVNGTVTVGEPDILYQSICWIKDVKKMWTHDTLYECDGSGETLTEADIANMGFTKNQGTITEVKMNGVSKGTSGVVDLGDVPTKDVVDGLLDWQYGADGDIANLYSDKQDVITDLATIRDGANKGATAVQPKDISEFITVEDVATVATSGSYNDLQDKPTIPSAVTESTVSGWGFTKNTGTITGVSANGTSVATSGVANIPAATTSKYGVTKLSSATNSTSTALAATASAVKSAYDLANGRQEKLVSGTNIKTINNTSILGSGNIAIDANIQAVETGETLDDVNTNTYVKYVEQTLTEAQKAQVRENIGVIEGGKEIIANKQESDSRFVFSNDSENGPLEPNKIYVSHFTVVFGINVFDIIPPTDLYAEYTIIFKTGGGTDYEGELTLPSYILWANGTIPTIEAQTNYELSISATKIDNEYVYKAVLVPFKSV